MEGKLFGTDGIRGIANEYPMTADIAMKVGYSTAYLFRNRHRRPKIIVGKDTRLSGYMLETAITSGICAMGVDVLLVGPLPTPGIAFITCSMRADAGVVISASHNTYEYNGIKIFSCTGYKLPDDTEARIERLILSGEIDSLPRSSASEIGKARRIEDAPGRYIVHLKNTFPRDISLEGLRLVIDCANGAAYRIAPQVFDELGAELIVTGNTPDGKNINSGCGSQHPEHLAKWVIRYKADAGFAFDGDGDRVIFADENGEILDGDYLMAICATHMLRNNCLRKKTVVGTVMSNLGLEIALKRRGARLVRAPVGDRYVVETMKENDYNLGGEQSGHVVFLDHSTTGDGILTALQVLAVMLKEQKPLSELKKVMDRYPQKLINVRVNNRKHLKRVPELDILRKQFEKRLGDEGRILIRASGTEPVIRVMAEGKDSKLIEETALEIAEGVKKYLCKD